MKHDGDQATAGETCLFWDDGAHDPAWNMAADEVLLLTARERGLAVLRFYQWNVPSVSIGYVQPFDAVDAGDGVDIVRRPTGGGIVYHNNDFTYSVVVPAHHWLTDLDRVSSYEWINRAIQKGLEYSQLPASLAQNSIPRSVDRSTMVCFHHPTRYDIVAGDRKIAGSAQRRTRDGLLHQGSINLESVPGMERVDLAQSVVRGFEDVMKSHLQPWMPPCDFLRFVEDRREQRYCTAEWLRSARDSRQPSGQEAHERKRD